MSMSVSINLEEMDVLRHTIRNRRYCGETPVVRSLVDKGLMKSVGRVDWCPDEYFAVTDAGRDMVAAFTDPSKIPLHLP